MNISSATLTLFGSSGSGGIGGIGGHRHHHGGGMQQLQTIADTLGISTDQLKQEMSSGSSLAQIAQNHGKTADDLINALQDKDRSRLDQDVASGKITQDQETELLSRLKRRETSFVDGTPSSGTPPGPPPGGSGDGGSSLDDVASLLGIGDFQSGSDQTTTSLGQALKAYGVDASSLENSLIDAIKSAFGDASGGGDSASSTSTNAYAQSWLASLSVDFAA